MTKQKRPNTARASKTPVCAFCGNADAQQVGHFRLSGIGDRSPRILVCRKCFAKLAAMGPGRSEVGRPTMTEKEMRQETRKQQALSRLGTDNPRCCGCLMNDRRCLELHHLEGEAFGNTLVLLCRNCHRKVTDPQKDHPGKLGDPPRTNESIGHYLLGIADLFMLIAEKLIEFGEYLIEQAAIAVGGKRPVMP
jgi:5-methylcytosine-specific restriction endonuclease McrA